LPSSVDPDMTVKVWDAQNGTELLTLALREKEFMRGRLVGAALSPDGKHFATAVFETVKDKENKITVNVWDAESGKKLLSLDGVGPRVAFSPDGKRLANGGSGSVAFWNVETGKELFGLPGHKITNPGAQPGDVAFSPDGKWLASTGIDLP